MQQEAENSKNLRWVRLIDPALWSVVPVHLFKQIDGLDESQVPAMIRAGQQTMNLLTLKESNKLALMPNEMVHIAFLVDEKNKIHGFVWAEQDLIERLIFVQVASIDKHVQGRMRQSMTDYLFSIFPQLNCIRMATTHVRAYTRGGWIKTPRTLMEITRDVFYRPESTQGDPDGEPVQSE